MSREAVTREEIGLLAIALGGVPDGMPIANVARYVGDQAESMGCSREVANFGEALVSAMIKSAGPR